MFRKKLTEETWYQKDLTNYKNFSQLQIYVSRLHDGLENQEEYIAKIQKDHKAEVERLSKQMEAVEQCMRNESVRFFTKLQELEAKRTPQGSKNELFILATKEGNQKEMGLYLQAGANIDAIDADGNTPLFISFLSDKLDIAGYLLENKANVEIVDRQGQTILHKLCRENSIDKVEFITQRLPKDDKEAKLMLSAYETATSTEVRKIIANAVLFQAAKQGNDDLATIALQKGADKDVQDVDGFTPLHVACSVNESKMVRFLLNNRCNINLVNDNNERPIETTCDEKVKDEINNYKYKNATQIATHVNPLVRGFLGRRQAKSEKEQVKKIIQKNSVELFNLFALLGKYQEIIELATAISKNELHKARQILRGNSEKVMATKDGEFKFRY